MSDIHVCPESLLTQLALPINPEYLQEAKEILSNTTNFHKIEKHLFSLQDSLQKVNGFIAISNKKSVLKIKLKDAEQSNEIVKEFHEIISKWAFKYNVNLSVSDTNYDVYYIVSVN